MTTVILMSIALATSASLYAQEAPDATGGLPPPDLPDPIRSGQEIEPEVTIIQRDKSVVEEYRVNGALYMMKVTPSVGPAYYLIDQDGDGRLESRTNKLGSDTAVPQWILFSW